jgi:hypothetical protein
VLWHKEKGSKANWSIRIGRYKNKQAAQDAIAGLLAEHSNKHFLALPEGKEPQENLQVKRMSNP